MKYKKRPTGFFVFCAAFLNLTGLIFPLGQSQDISVEMLLNNLTTGHFSGKSVDFEIEDAGIEEVFSRLESISGISFELSPDIPLDSSAEITYRFKQVPWDRILSQVLEEFHLEAIPMSGGVYIQQKENNMMRIVREDQFRRHEASHVPPLMYALIASVLAAGISGLLLYRKRQKAKNTSSGGFVVDPEKADEIMKRVRYLFDVEKIYRKEDISLHTLSKELSMPSYQVSWIINKKMNVTFSGLVNSYRVEEVKKRLASSDESDKTILDIAFDAGFNTKTSFNRVFKKFTRMTPSRYRERYQRKIPHGL